MMELENHHLGAIMKIIQTGIINTKISEYKFKE